MDESAIQAHVKKTGKFNSNKFEICDNGNGTYDVTAAGEKETLTEEELGGLTPKLVIELACESDIELEF